MTTCEICGDDAAPSILYANLCWPCWRKMENDSQLNELDAACVAAHSARIYRNRHGPAINVDDAKSEIDILHAYVRRMEALIEMHRVGVEEPTGNEWQIVARALKP